MFLVVFQSTHPYGCDETDRQMILDRQVSIHAPIRVRHLIYQLYSEGYGFNPRTHTGATFFGHNSMEQVLFQSTHPYGCDVG